MGGGAWPFLVGGAICLVNSDNERDSVLLNSWISFVQIQILLRGTGLRGGDLPRARGEFGHACNAAMLHCRRRPNSLRNPTVAKKAFFFAKILVLPSLCLANLVKGLWKKKIFKKALKTHVCRQYQISSIFLEIRFCIFRTFYHLNVKSDNAISSQFVQSFQQKKNFQNPTKNERLAAISNFQHFFSSF